MPNISFGSVLSVLPQDVQDEVIRILNVILDDVEAYTELKTLVAPHAEALLKVNVVAGYFPVMALQVRHALRQQQQAPPKAKDLFGDSDPSLN